MSVHGRTLVAAAAAVGLLMCCARMAGGMCQGVSGHTLARSFLSLFGQECRTPPCLYPEETTARLSAVAGSIPKAAPVPPGLGSPTLTGGVAQHMNL